MTDILGLLGVEYANMINDKMTVSMSMGISQGHLKTGGTTKGQ